MFNFIFLVWLKAKREDEAAVPPAGGTAAALGFQPKMCSVSLSML